MPLSEEAKEKAKVTRKKNYEARKAAGLCTTCGKAAETGKALCAMCASKSTGSQRRYYRNKAAGLCRSCGKDAGGKSYCEDCTVRVKKNAKVHYEKSKEAGSCHCCGKPSDGKVQCAECRVKNSDGNKVRYQQLRDEVFAAYGGYKCVGCGYTTPEALQIDHINGGGNEHRREIGIGKLYSWLKHEGFPTGFRVLCSNCNTLAARGLPFPNQSKEPTNG